MVRDFHLKSTNQAEDAIVPIFNDPNILYIFSRYEIRYRSTLV